MENFFACMKDRTDPISDVYTHHNAMTTCHLANISIRLGRKINWNSRTEEIVDDSEANQWQSREQRKGFETSGKVFDLNVNRNSMGSGGCFRKSFTQGRMCMDCFVNLFNRRFQLHAQTIFSNQFRCI